MLGNIATAPVSVTTVIFVPTTSVTSGAAITSTATSATATSPASDHSRHLTARGCMYFWRPIHHIFYVCRGRIEVITQPLVAQDVGLQTNKVFSLQPIKQEVDPLVLKHAFVFSQLSLVI